MPYIYKIINNLNQKMYIGKTTNTIEHRWKEHCQEYKRDQEKSRPLYAAMNKYGLENFTIEKVEECSMDILNKREQFWSEYYGTFKFGYNATMGGDGKVYADYDLVYSLFNLGKTNKEICEITGYTDKTVTKILEIKGINSEERKKRGYTNRKMVLMLDNNNKILKIFASMMEAERFLKKSGAHRHISEVCNGKRKSAYGYFWKWYNNSYEQVT